MAHVEQSQYVFGAMLVVFVVSACVVCVSGVCRERGADAGDSDADSETSLPVSALAREAPG